MVVARLLVAQAEIEQVQEPKVELRIYFEVGVLHQGRDQVQSAVEDVLGFGPDQDVCDCHERELKGFFR
jgi:hypothetical protein